MELQEVGVLHPGCIKERDALSTKSKPEYPIPNGTGNHILNTVCNEKNAQFSKVPNENISEKINNNVSSLGFFALLSSTDSSPTEESIDTDVIDDVDSEAWSTSPWDKSEDMDSLGAKYDDLNRCDSSKCDPQQSKCDGCKNLCSNLRKRNRQISTDSGSSVAIELKDDSKANRRPKKKERRKHYAEEEEVQKILDELEMKCVPGTVSEMSDQRSVTESKENVIPCDKNKKKKKKKGRNAVTGEVARNGGPYSGETNIEMNGSDSQKENKCLRKSDSDYSSEPTASVELTKKMDDARQKTDGVEVDKNRKKPGKKQLAAIHAALQKAKEHEEQVIQEETNKKKRAEEVEKQRLEKLRQENEKKEKKKQKEKDRKERLRAEGKFLTKSQKNARAKVEAALSAWREHGIQVPNVGEKKNAQDTKGKRPYVMRSLSSRSSESQQEVGSGEEAIAENSRRLSIRQRHLTDPQSFKDAVTSSDPNKCSLSETELSLLEKPVRVGSSGEISSKAKSKFKEPEMEYKFESEYRSPVVCVLGHVDTGKTKLLDKVRKTNVQNNEAGGITQQIGATMVPHEALKEKCKMVNYFSEFKLKLPGLLIIDTPGHESFRNLRFRGSSLCDIAILVVDIMHGIEQQTIESIELLKNKKTPFVVALNKVDRLYGWQSNCGADIEGVLKQQENITFMEFDKRCKEVIAGFANQEINATLFYENTDPKTWISLVPVSAASGDGMGNLLAVVCQLSQNLMSKHLKFSEELQATVLEVKTTSGFGTTLDVILVNGHLKESDTIILVGQEGPIVTQIRSLLMPQPLRELRVKNPYQEFKSIKGAQGVKISGKDLDKAIAGLPIFVARSSDEIPVVKENVVRMFKNMMNSIKLSDRGVYVQASTLGSLEAILDFLKSSQVPYAGVKVGPVVKKDVIKASVMLEHDVQYAAILAFDVKIERDAQELADHLGIKIFPADIIYHLIDNYVLYRDELLEKRRNDLKKCAVFPCKLKILPDYIFNTRNPLSIGVCVEAGILRLGTPICVPSKNFIDLGTVTSIESENVHMESAKESDVVCIKIEQINEESSKTYGRHFDHTDLLVSKISRQTIDVCKEFHRDDLRKSDWNLMVELKKLFAVA